MEIILTTNCKSFTGKIGSGYGYYIRKIKSRFFSQRSPKGVVPPEGHWRFILACAELAQLNLHIAKIKVNAQEVHDALYEAGYFILARRVLKYLQPTALMNANDIINLKKTSDYERESIYPRRHTAGDAEEISAY